jgi:sugar lactone lactonase YvrE
VNERISGVRPPWTLPGARVSIGGALLPLPADGPPHVLVGGEDAHVVAASSRGVRVVIPPTATGGLTAIHIDELPGQTAYVEVGRPLISGVHQVDSPLFSPKGELYATESGSRRVRVPSPLFRVTPEGARDPLKVDIANPTSLALGPDGALYVSNRFEGQVFRIAADGTTDLYASDLGVPTGLAFGPDGALFVGDRSGTVHRVRADRTVDEFATLPASVAAFHLAFGPGGDLFVSAPTLASRDQIYRITPDRTVSVVDAPFGRPQGLAFDESGALYVADALAGSAGIYKVNVAGERPEIELVLSAPSIVGLAFDPAGGLIAASNDTLWRLDVPIRPWRG